MKEKIIAEINRLKGELEGYSAREALDYIESYINTQPSLPSNLDKAAEEYADEHRFRIPYDGSNNFYDKVDVKASLDGFKAGAEWMAGQGWIDDGRMPAEKKEESDTLQGHHEWTASEPVLAWDSMYGPRIDFTRNGKWVSEAKGGYTGQVCHGIVAWMPIPQYKQ